MTGSTRARGLAHHQAGRLADAERAYRAALADNPADAESLHLLGLLARQAGREEDAVALIGQAIALDPLVPAYHRHLGDALAALRRLEEAAACYRRAIAPRPDDAAAHYNLGNTLDGLGQPEAAADCYRRAIALRPDMAAAHNNLGNVLRASGQAGAAASYRRAIELDPTLAEAHANLGHALREAGALTDAAAAGRRAVALAPETAAPWLSLGATLLRLDEPAEAEACFRQALSVRPDDSQAWLGLGCALHHLDRLEEAARACRRALAARPDDHEAHHTLGRVLADQGRPAEAVACYQAALRLRPAELDVRNDFGNALRALDHLDQAVACLEGVLDIRPDHPHARINLGITRVDQGKLDAAIACFRAEVALRPESGDGHFYLALALLASGDLAEGWREYEWRWRTGQFHQRSDLSALPQWRGEPATGRSLLIHAEQGFGDTLQFCRYAPLAAARGLRVALMLPAPLCKLLRGLPGVTTVLEDDAPLPMVDLRCPMLSLPLAFATTLETIPACPAYLQADAAVVAEWQRRLPSDRLRVGVTWAGSARSRNPSLAAINGRRSLAPALLAPLFDVPGVRFFSLQKDGPPAPAGFPLIDHMAEMTDFADTAALVATLDLMICVDSAVAHLAAGLGRPVWLLDRHSPCWRWLAGRRDSPWYPTLRIYRQGTAGDWAGVIAEVARDLRALAGIQAGGASWEGGEGSLR